LGIAGYIAKGATQMTYSVASPANFRSAISAAAATHPHDASDINTGILPIVHGGTGLKASPSMLVKLDSTSAANVLQASPRPGITGTLPISHGGTGATTAAAALKALGAQAAGRYATTNSSGYINTDDYTGSTDRDFMIGAGTVTNTKSTLKGHNTALYIGTERT
jgi:hypothetical protein